MEVKPIVPPRSTPPESNENEPFSNRIEPTEPTKSETEPDYGVGCDLESDECQRVSSYCEEYANSFQLKSPRMSLERFFPIADPNHVIIT